MNKTIKNVVLDTKYLAEVKPAQEYIKEQFGFPEYYGCNLDAFHDCISEAGNLHVQVKGARNAAAAEGYAARVLQVLEDCCMESSSLSISYEHSYQLIALDMDGTALNSDKKVSKATADAIHAALAAGKEVVFCSGRCLAEMRATLEQFPDMHYLIAESGAFVYDLRENKVLHQSSIPEDVVFSIRDLIRGRDIMPVIFSGGEYFVNEEQVQRLPHYQMPGFVEVIPPIATGLSEDIFEYVKSAGTGYEKLNLFHTEPAERAITRKQLEEAGYPKLIEIVNSEISSLECSPKNVDKGFGMKVLAEETGISIKKMIAVGDADNDLGALKAAGLSVAMGNANDHVKEICEVVVPDNDHDGCAAAIYRYLMD